jgi:hypothetical protein
VCWCEEIHRAAADVAFVETIRYVRESLWTRQIRRRVPITGNTDDSHAMFDGGGTAAVVVHVALGGPAELLGAVEARDISPAVQIVQLGGGKVNCLTVTRRRYRSLAVDDFWNMDKSGVFTMVS